MKVSKFLHTLVSPFKRIFHHRTVRRKDAAIASIWSEDDEELKQHIRIAKEFFKQNYQEHPEPRKIEKESDIKDPYSQWKKEYDQAVDKLDEELKVPFKLFIQGNNYQKIADMLQMDVETVRQ